MNQTELLKPLYNYTILKDIALDESVTSLTNDSRKITPGCGFIAIQGEQFDGHRVLAEVIEAGARLIIVEKKPKNIDSLNATIVHVPSTVKAQAILGNQFYQEPSKKMDVVAVTGTNGKTTITHMINFMLERIGHRTGLIGTVQYKIDQQILPAINTTPDSLSLQQMYHQMVEASCQDVLLEASSHALMLGRLWYTSVNCAIFTNLTREHLDFHKTMDGYAQAKSLLFSQLGQQFNVGRAPLAIINQDDGAGELMSAVTSADIVTYSLQDKSATAYAHSITSSSGRTDFVMEFQGESYEVMIPVRGSYNVSNFLASCLCLVYYYDYDVTKVIEMMQHFEGVSGRMQSIQEGQPYEVIVDFAHTTDALERVLSELVAHKSDNQRLITLMGHSGGNRDSEARPELGNILFKYSDLVILTADNPRYEDVTKICQEMIGSHNDKAYHIVVDRKEAIQFAVDQAQTNDILVFLGKGGEPYQVIENQYLPYDEASVVRQTIQDKLSKSEG